MKSIYVRNKYENYWQQLEEMTSENVSLNYLVNEAVKNYAEAEKEGENE